jgi:hypothetical protein
MTENSRQSDFGSADFRRNANSDAVQQVGALLRHYQAEVDQLTARSALSAPMTDFCSAAIASAVLSLSYLHRSP